VIACAVDPEYQETSECGELNNCGGIGITQKKIIKATKKTNKKGDETKLVGQRNTLDQLIVIGVINTYKGQPVPESFEHILFIRKFKLNNFFKRRNFFIETISNSGKWLLYLPM
jgi:hypothetical protein